MSKLAAVAERLAQTRRWLDQEADRLAARLDQLEKRAPLAIQNAHRILDEQQRELDATEKMVQHWLSASADVSGSSNNPRELPQAARTQLRQSNESASASLEPAHQFLHEQQKGVGQLERALQTLANEPPEAQHAGASQPASAQPKQSNDGALTPIDSRRLLDEQQKDEGGLERALQTLANKLASPQRADASQPTQLKQSNDAAPAPLAAARRFTDESPKGEDVAKQATRKLGVVRVA